MKNSLWNIISIIMILFLSIMALYLYSASKASYNKIILLTEHKKILETSIAKITEQKKSLEDKLASLSAENGEALVRINKYNARMEAMTSEYKVSMEGTLAERDKLRQDIAAFNHEISGKNSEILFLKKSLKKIDKKLRGTGSKYGATPVSLAPIVVTRPKSVSGKIIEVNKNYEFIIVNLGSDDGISAGDTLFVSRRKALLGKVVVEEAAGKYSAARVLHKSLGDMAEKGDIVTN